MRLQGLTVTINTSNGRVSRNSDNGKTFKPAERHNLEFELGEMEVETSDYEAIFSGETKILETTIPSLKSFLQEVDAEDEENHNNKVESLNNRIRLAKKEAEILKSDSEW